MTERERFGAEVGRKAARRLRVRGRPDSVWSWLGMLGLIGWSVAVPTVLGVVLGRWLDRVAPAGFSWVISLLVVGLAVGILNAWFWVLRASRGREPNDREPDMPGVTPVSPEEVNGDDR
ncbi:MAG TPA: AtpZ/AtpI family protein [Acidimicrobiia bacterium]|nr:AtpZ/AtpI family protein [Acidimicrobiia bacterium]